MPKDPTPAPDVLVDARFAIERKGGDRCRFELARELACDTARYAFLAYDDTASALRQAVGGSEIYSTARRPWEHPSGDFFEHVGLPRLARSLGAGIYHGTFNVLPAIPGFAPTRRTVVTIHDVAVFKMPEAYTPRFCRMSRFLIRRAVRSADRIIVVSSATKSELIQLFPSIEPKVRIILNGVGGEFVAAATFDGQRIAQAITRLGLPERYVLFVGNLEKKKNLPRLLSAFAAAKAASSLAHKLVIVGKRPDGVPDVDLDRALGDGLAMYTGYLPDEDLPSVYRGADLVVYPSLYEGFGMPVLEGLAAGVPVLTSNCSSMPEVAAGAAMLVDPLSVDDIAQGIVAALTDANWRKQAISRGMARAGALSWKFNAAQTARVYDELREGLK